jgi:threonine dehydratase
MVACSAGNLGAAVAYACKKFKIKGTLFIPRTVSNAKVLWIKSFG